MDWLWHALLVSVIVIPVAILWLAIIIELFRRHDLSTPARIVWLLVILVFPLLGSLAYVIVTWLRADAAIDLGAAPVEPGVPQHPATIADLTRLDELRRSGVISDEDFEQGKRRVLEGSGGSAGRQASTDKEVGS